MDDIASIKRSFINTYLDSPIIEGDALRTVIELNEALLVTGPVPPKLRTAKKIVELIDKPELTLQMYDPHDLEGILDSLPSSGCKTYMTDAHTIAESLFSGVEESIEGRLGIPKQRTQFPPPTPLARSYLNKAELFVQYTDTLAASRATGGRNPVKVTVGHHTLVGTQYSAVLWNHSDECADVLPYEAVLMIKDMCLGRSNVYEALRVTYDTNHEIHVRVSQALEWCLQCLTTYGNKGYEVLKSIECICKAFVIEMNDPLFSGEGAFTRLCEMVREKERKFRGDEGALMIDKLVRILRSCEKTETVIELFGLQKLTGHPLIDPRAGGKSAAEEASMPRRTQYKDAIRLRNNWRRMYLEGFVRRTGRWPPLTFSDQAKSTRLYQLYSVRERKLNRQSYPLQDWDGVRFGKHIEFEYYTNYLDLMDDKAISFYLSEFRTTWRKDVKPRSHRRLLLEMLSRPDFSIRGIIDLVERDEIPADWMIVSLYPKEREFKLSARMFSMMVFEMRVFFSCLEANLATGIFPYLPQQTMTLKKTEILEKFFNLTRPSSNEKIERLFLEIDLSRWNLRWRDLPIRLIGEDLNDIFGFSRCYTQIHSFFKNCMILVRVSGYEPDGLDMCPPPESDLLWYNHEGGFEGIAQKHWTLATYSMIDLGVQKYDFNYHILGQADNQIILAYIDVSDQVDRRGYVRGIASSVTKDISESCERVGQDAKPDECLESSSVVTYSKDFFVNGADYFMTVKAFSRIFPRGTSEFPTIINCVGAIGSGCVASAEKMKDPLRAYYLMLYHACRYLLSLKTRASLESMCLTRIGRSKLTPGAVRNLVTLPSSLGGLPLPTPVSFLYKGGADSLSKDISSVSLFPHDDQKFLWRCLEEILKGRWTKEDHSAESILLDPYSLPISSVPLAESRVQRVSLDHVKEAARANLDISEVVSADIDLFEESVIKTLMSVKPFNPAFLADILDLSVVGTKKMISKMFTSTRTVQELTHGDDSDPGGTILRTSASSFSHIVARIMSIGRSQSRSKDPFTLASVLRKRWCKLKNSPIKSVDGVTSYVPLGWNIRTGNRKPRGDEIQVVFQGGENATFQRGPNEPYLGSETHEKRTKYGYKIVVSSSADKAASHLYRILTQPGVSESFEHLVDKVAETRTDTCLLDLKQISSRSIGGTIAHRYMSSFDMQHASLVGCGSFAGYIVLQSDHAGQLSASLNDYPVMFQEFFAAGIGLLNFAYHRGHRTATTLGFVVPTNLIPLPDEDVKVDIPLTGPVPRLRRNKIVYSEDLKLLRQEQPYANPLVGCVKGGNALETPVALARTAAARELRRHSSAYSVSDTSTGSIRLSFDILEYRGLGLSNIVDGIAEAIADHTYHSLFVRAGTVWRWTAMPLIASLGSAFSHSLVRAASHPLFLDDTFTSTVIRPSEMRYSYYKAAHRVSREIAVRAHRKFTSRPRTDRAGQRLLFMDDEDSSSLECVITMYRKGLVLAVMAGEITADEAYDINRITLLQRMRSCVDTPGRLNSVFGSALVLQEHSQRHSLTQLCEFMEALTQGKLVSLIDGTLAESLRLRRRFNMTTRSLTSVELEGGGWQDSPYPYYVDPELDQADNNESTYLTLTASHVLTDEWKRFSFRRRHSRQYGYDAPAVHSFWPSRRSLRSETLLILGSGNGGCAAVAGSINIERVILHDLQSDIQPEAWQNPVLSIPAVSRTRSRTLYERSRAGFGSHNGDLDHNETWVDLSQLAPINTCVVYDIPMYVVSQLVELVSKMVVHFPGSPLVTRWISSWDNFSRLIPCFAASFDDMEIYPVFVDEFGAELVIRVTISPTQTLQPFSNQFDVGPLSLGKASSDGIDRFGGGYNHNWYSEFADLDIDTGEDEHLISHDGLSLTDDASTKSHHGYTYSQWTRVLWYKLACSLRSLKGKEREDRYIELLSSGTVTVQLGKRSLSLVPSNALDNFLTRTLPRCLSD